MDYRKVIRLAIKTLKRIYKGLGDSSVDKDSHKHLEPQNPSETQTSMSATCNPSSQAVETGLWPASLARIFKLWT